MHARPSGENGGGPGPLTNMQNNNIAEFWVRRADSEQGVATALSVKPVVHVARPPLGFVQWGLARL